MTHTVETLGLDRGDTFTNWFDDISTGRALCTSGGIIEAAQDRVAMRRYIRRHYPSLGAAVAEMKTAELSNLVDEIKMLKGGLQS